MDQDWYYGVGDDTLGPVSFEDLVAALRTQPDWRDVPVWCSDFTDWRPAKDVHQIAFRLGRGTQQAAPHQLPGGAAMRPDAAQPKQPQPISPSMPVEGLPKPNVSEDDAAKDAQRKRLLLIGAGVAALIVVAIAGVMIWQPSTPPLERSFARIIQETKPTLPKKADEGTSLTDITQSESKLVYHHVWDGPRFAIPGNLGALMKSRKLAEICAAAKDIFANGGTVEYSYRSQSGLFIASFEVKKEDCA